LDGDSLKSFDVDDPSRLAPRQQSDLPYLFGETQDLRVIENTDIESVSRELKHDCDFNWALDLTLISLDAELPDDIRKEAIEGLDELLADSRVIERLESVLYARPLPEDAELAGALKLCERAPLSNYLLQRLDERQPLIFVVSQSWDTIPTKIFGGYDQQAEFQHVAVQEGLFRTLVIALETQTTISTFLLNAGLNNSINQLRNSRQVLQQWVNPFRQAGDTPEIKPEIEVDLETEMSPRRRHGRRFGIDRPAVLREVNKKKAFITEAMRRRDFERVHELTDDLVRYHQSNSEPKHTAKSLCDLAMEAKALGIYSLQLELTERSTNIAPGDAWSWAQHGDALLNMQRLDDALRAYQQAGSFGAGVVAGTGQAEVLKAKGQLDEALAAFDEVIIEHPENVVAKTGRAEVLKAKGELDRALAAFNEVIREHPENVVAKTGRAEVLKATGQLNEALAAFNEVIREHPGDVVAKNGRAEVLKAKGQLNEALAAFNEVIREHPENVVAKNGRAEVLKAKGQFQEALDIYNKTITEHPEDRIAGTGRSCILAALGRYTEALEYLQDKNPVTQDDWIDYHVRGMILLRTGKMSEAIRIFNHGLQNNPWHSSREYFRSALALAWLRGRNFKKAGQMLEEVRSPQLQPSANVLRIHVFGAEGDLQRATTAYDSLATKPEIRSNELTQELRHQFILKEAPRHDEEWIFDREVKILLLAA
jgi:tetratricopeptide (TPR) repeat protein